MSNQYRLVGLGNSELLAGLSELAQQSNVLTAQLLAHLVELEERKLHLQLGFSSLFAYCVEVLRMSEGAAGRRVTAARLCRRFPEVFERVASGDLHLCALCALAPHLNPENANELFDVCQGKTRRQVEELLAVRFPRADVREQIRRLPVRAQPGAAAPQTLPAAQLVSPPPAPQVSVISQNSVPNPVSNPVPTPAAARVGDARRRARELEPLSRDRFGVHFTADAELRELLERARALASHRLPNGDLAGLIKLMAASFVRQEEKRRFGLGVRPRRAKVETETARAAEANAPPGEVSVSSVSPAPEATAREAGGEAAGERGRHLPAAVRREIHSRDRGQCAFVPLTADAAALGRFSSSTTSNLMQERAQPMRRTSACCARLTTSCMLEIASERCISLRKSRPEGFEVRRKWSAFRSPNRESREQCALTRIASPVFADSSSVLAVQTLGAVNAG